MIVAALAIPIMTQLARRKIEVATQLSSRAMRADTVESIICGWLSVVVVVGLFANLALGAWWVDAVTSLAILWFVVKEAREAWSGEDCCDTGRQIRLCEGQGFLHQDKVQYQIAFAEFPRRNGGPKAEA